VSPLLPASSKPPRRPPPVHARYDAAGTKVFAAARSCPCPWPSPPATPLPAMPGSVPSLHQRFAVGGRADVSVAGARCSCYSQLPLTRPARWTASTSPMQLVIARHLYSCTGDSGAVCCPSLVVTPRLGWATQAARGPRHFSSERCSPLCIPINSMCAMTFAQIR
jgi:hypothetical protein